MHETFVLNGAVCAVYPRRVTSRQINVDRSSVMMIEDELNIEERTMKAQALAR
jgi:hypothetical protein